MSMDRFDCIGRGELKRERGLFFFGKWIIKRCNLLRRFHCSTEVGWFTGSGNSQLTNGKKKKKKWMGNFCLALSVKTAAKHLKVKVRCPKRYGIPGHCPSSSWMQVHRWVLIPYRFTGKHWLHHYMYPCCLNILQMLIQLASVSLLGLCPALVGTRAWGPGSQHSLVSSLPLLLCVCTMENLG